MGDASENRDVPLHPFPSHLCHCEEGQGPDVAIQRPRTTTPVTLHPVIARSAATRQSSDRAVNHRIAPASYATHQTGLPRHDVARNDSVEGDDPDWIATPRRTRNYSLQARHVLQRGRGSSFRRSRMDSDGGRGGIRTPGTVSGSAVFKTAALDHSATLPEVGATCRTRTDDLRFTKPLLYQLS